MRNTIAAGLSAAALAITLGTTSVFAQGGEHPEVPAGAPNCHGQRMAAGASEGFTPRDRYEILVENNIDPKVQTMGDYQARVKASCETPLPQQSGLHQ